LSLSIATFFPTNHFRNKQVWAGAEAADRDRVTATEISPPATAGLSDVEKPLVASLEHVSFNYRSKVALSDVSFQVRKGEIVALLGHNGAGKTTTILLMNGLLRADGGRMSVLGLDPYVDGPRLRLKTAVVTDSLGLHERDTPRKTFEYHAQLWNLDPDEAVERGMALLDRFGLTDRAHDRIKSFSRGMRQRMAIARALVNDPELILLDEPTLGMDPVARQDFRELLEDLRQSGVSVVISTHDLGEVERICNRLVIMQQGRTIIEGTPQDCMKPFMRDIDVEIECSNELSAAGKLALTAMDDLGQLHFTSSVAIFRAADSDAVAEAVRRLVAAGENILRVGSKLPSLEDVYLRIHHAGHQRDQVSAPISADPNEVAQ
jgi:ABC-2 type transport system ATP-binding protein